MTEDVDLIPGVPRDEAGVSKPANGSGRLWLRAVTIATIILLSAYIGSGLARTWLEWRRLERDLRIVERGQVVLYPGIARAPSGAAPPGDWFQPQGESVRLWAGWKPGVGHRWFFADLNSIARDRLTPPLGRDVIRAIDDPILEARGGKIWETQAPDMPVFGQELEGVPCVYPLVVIGNVHVVNELIQGHPYLVLFRPTEPITQAVSIFDARIDGHRITFGSSGYALDGSPLLYDRKSESLWVERGDELRAISGARNGSSLKRQHVPKPIAWGEWSRDRPESRLLVGAVRTAPLPSE